MRCVRAGAQALRERMNDIEAVKQQADIVAVISQYVSLKAEGRRYKANCPFHQEKTPSFIVNPELQIFVCFGCGAKGDVFGFLMQRENLSFPEALREVARQVGYELSGGRGGAPHDDHGRLIEANEAAVQFFRDQLLTAPAADPARVYVERRGVDEPTAETFQLGYAPNSFDALRSHLVERGFTVGELVQAGLLSEGEHQPYDRFRDRLMFPIRDERGRVIAFGGRVLGEGVPKYLNSPQTALFDKSGTLYALDLAKDAIRTAGSAVVVEGYMDVIAAHQHGIRNVVATLGTALTEKHVQILKRFTKRVTLAMDADAAGQEAMSRGLAVVERAAAADPDAPVETTVDWRGMVYLHAVAPVEVAVFTVPQGKDPDELIRADPDAFNRLAERAMPPFEFRLRHELSKADRTNARAMVELTDRLLPVLSGISDRRLQAHYLSQLATATGLREDDLRGRLPEGRTPSALPAAMSLKERTGRPRPAVDRDSVDPLTRAGGPVTAAAGAAARQEMLCLHLLYSFAGLRMAGMLLDEGLFEDAANRYLFQVWRGSPNVSLIPDLLDEPLRARLTTVLTLAVPPFDEVKAARALEDTVNRMQLRRLDERKRLSLAAIHETESMIDRTHMLELASSLLSGNSAPHETDAMAEAALDAIRDVEAGVELHRHEAALRRGEKREM
ncbi:MAG: DNA primase [Dehalococcoidia bacterium]